MSRLLARNPVHTLRFAYGAVTQGTWQQVLAACPQPACAVEIFDSSGKALSISLGTPGNEAASAIPYTITPNGSSILLPIEVAKGKPISIQPLDGDIVEGQLILNFFG